MLLTTPQVAQKFNVSNGAVHNWVKKGLLKDYSGKTGPRHEYKFKSKEVNDFKKIYLPHKRKYTNGAEQDIPKTVTESFSSHTTELPTYVRSEGFGTRLDRIEEKLDRILRLWS